MQDQRDTTRNTFTEGLLDKRLVRLAVLTAVYLCLTLPFLGRVPLVDPDEGYYPETAREMTVRGNWFDPVFNGEPRWGKPIGFYLAQAASFQILGASEFSARLPSVLAGLGFMLLSAALGARLFNSRTGFYAGLFSASAIQPVVYARTAVPDMLLGFFICLSLYGFVVWEQSDENQRQGQWGLALAYLGAALAFLVKGPLGLLLPGITVPAYLVLSGRAKEVLRLRILGGGTLFLLVAAPWFVYMYQVHGTAYLEEFFLQRNLQRYFTDRWAHAGPLYYYLPILIIGSFPWTLALIGGAAESLRRLMAPRTDVRSQKKHRNSELFIWCWFGVMLLFFSFSKSKLPNYVLPLYPAAALLSGRFLADTENSPVKKRLLLLVGGTAVLALAALVFGISPVAERLGMPRGLVLWTLAPVGLIPLAALGFLFRKRLELFCAFSVAAMAFLFAMVSGVTMPQADRFRAIKSFSRNRLEHLENGERILCLHVWPPSLLFYTGRNVIRFDPYSDRLDDFLSEGGRWVVTRERSLALLDSLMQHQPPAELHRIGHHVLVRLENDTEDANGPPP